MQLNVPPFGAVSRLDFSNPVTQVSVRSGASAVAAGAEEPQTQGALVRLRTYRQVEPLQLLRQGERRSAERRGEERRRRAARALLDTRAGERRRQARRADDPPGAAIDIRA